MQLTPYHAKYFAYDLTRQLPFNDLGKLTASLQDAQVDLNPQFCSQTLTTIYLEIKALQEKTVALYGTGLDRR